MSNERALRYGNNPHQGNASFIAPPGAIEFINGNPSYINLLDILTGWQMTRDLSLVSGQVATVSMKHCTPVGLAVPGPIDEFTKALLGIERAGPVASSYLRVRSSDWGAAYGDIVVVFGEVDEELSDLLSRVVSDGIAATGFTDSAQKALKRKRGGQYLVAKLDPEYVPPTTESRELFGIRVTQERNAHLPNPADFHAVVGAQSIVDQSADDLCLAVIAMKYSVSNNIVIASGGRTLSISAGQQSRILSTKLACSKFDRYLRLQHPEIIDLTRLNTGKLTDRVARANSQAETLSVASRKLGDPVVLASDGFIPFNDNIEEASKHNIDVILEPEGAARRAEVEASAESLNIALVRTKHRYFYH